MKLSDIRMALGLPPGTDDDQIIGICDLSRPDNNSPDWLSWIADRNIEAIPGTIYRTLICSPEAAKHPQLAEARLLIVDNPRSAFGTVMRLFDTHARRAEISPSAHVSESAWIDPTCSIGQNCVVEDDVSVSAGTAIGHNTVILKGTVIGSHVIIGNNCTIGGVGFGYEKNEAGEYDFIPHFGNVVIDDQVEIGNNTCIDRAVLGSTRIRRNAKIDNLVHISHGCDIGENALIIANAMVAGSVQVGAGSWVAPSASILNQKKIGAGATVGLGAVVVKDVPDGDVVVGNPSRSIKR